MTYHPPNMSELAERAAGVQRLFEDVFSALGALSVTASDSSGAVTVTMRASGLGQIRIDPAVANPNQVDVLEDLVLQALRNAAHQLNEQAGETFGPDDLNLMNR
ncbi:hypothetical protein Val02_45270 [Virgisporangium aliadipatigenens]|uniref:Nucleoid-associated protein n=1 Tax=Virgisporangium aliadipatigenens TaxID=741659 RepID=A0A8J3YLZ2_9ACTN|nr:YbaB/EbfC family nucleoid-associated protein [Virgisporangium aliadipatigenens]GIJ47641.1 hypothetical protein Val02_45270 [Virgisporangium aliadipatigenens]